MFKTIDIIAISFFALNIGMFCWLQRSLSKKTHLVSPTIVMGSNTLFSLINWRSPRVMTSNKKFGSKTIILTILSIFFFLCSLISLVDSTGFDFSESFTKQHLIESTGLSKFYTPFIAVFLYLILALLLDRWNNKNIEEFKSIKFKYNNVEFSPEALEKDIRQEFDDNEVKLNHVDEKWGASANRAATVANKISAVKDKSKYVTEMNKKISEWDEEQEKYWR